MCITSVQLKMAVLVLHCTSTIVGRQRDTGSRVLGVLWYIHVTYFEYTGGSMHRILHVSSHIRYIICVDGWISMDQFPVAIPGTCTTVRQTPAVLVLYWSTRSTVYWSI